MSRVAILFAFASVCTAALIVTAQAATALPLVNVRVFATSPQMKCILSQTSLALPKGWSAIAYVVSTIETEDKTLASITILVRNLSLRAGGTFDLLVTSTDSRGWDYFRSGSAVGIATYAMKPTAQLIQRRTATSLGVVDLSSCN